MFQQVKPEGFTAIHQLSIYIVRQEYRRKESTFFGPYPDDLALSPD